MHREWAKKAANRVASFYGFLNIVWSFLCRISVILSFLQLPLGLMPELIVPSIWPMVLFPDFLGTLPNLIF